MTNREFIGYQEALTLTLAQTQPLAAELVSVFESTDRVVSSDIYSRVDSPSVDTSLKDGFAVRAADVANATSGSPVRLKLIDVVPAGAPSRVAVAPGTAVRVLTGARVPAGADAVVPDELASIEDKFITVVNHADAGRNILPKGCDVAKLEKAIAAGGRLTPGQVGLLAAAGHGTVSVIRSPRVAIVATGDEVVAPGEPLTEGQLFASNMTTLNAWCRRFGMNTTLEIIGDKERVILETLDRLIRTHDAVLTSGGAWTGDRDLVVRMLTRLGWEKVYHRVRIGPGKAVGFGRLHGVPVFVLPGGPPSNLVAFLKLALPGLLKLAGNLEPRLPEMPVTLWDPVDGQRDWTQFIFGRFDTQDGECRFHPIRYASRLKSIAEAEGIISVAEGIEHIPSGSRLNAMPLL